MDLHYSSEDLAFRDQVRAFLAEQLPAELQAKVRQHKRMQREDYVRWHKILAKQGWVAPGWPVEHGGPGWTPVQRHIWEEECARAATRPTLPSAGTMVAPVTRAFASENKKPISCPASCPAR